VSSEVDICNSALIKIGAEPINTLLDNNKQARLCNQQYSRIRDELLTSHYWNFAMKRVALGLLPDPPLFGFSLSYQLPADCLRVRTINQVSEPFKIEGRKLYTDLAECKIQYVSNNIDVNDYMPTFREALALRIAADLAYPLVQSVTLSDRMFNKSIVILKDARSIDGQEGTLDDFEQDVWLESRLTGPGILGNVKV